MVVPKFRAVFKNKIISEVGSIDFINKTVTIPIYDKETDEYLADYELSLDLVTLMQSTGLFDINGKEIFEGDIVRMHSGELLPVKLHHGMFEPVCYYISNVFERVGNVFKNPELLEHPDFREVLND